MVSLHEELYQNTINKLKTMSTPQLSEALEEIKSKLNNAQEAETRYPGIDMGVQDWLAVLMFAEMELRSRHMAEI